jgi:S1-C subfamily serine protease
MQRQQWALLVSSARWFLTNCRDLLAGDAEASTLSMIGIGLTQQGNFDDAVPVLVRCVTIKPDAAYCFEDLGEALAGLGRFGDARKAYEQAISIGGYDQVNGAAIGAARRNLAALPPAQPIPAPDKTNGDAPASSGGKKFGTGFFVSAEGHILTNDHVVEGCKSLATKDGEILSVVSRNPGADLALLKTDVKPSAFAVFGGKPPRVGEAVMAFGFPLPGLLTPEGNSTTGIVSALSGPNGDLNVIQITAPVQPGNSGGPLVDEHGRVVGIVVAKLDAVEVARATGDIPQNVNFAIRGNLLTTFLDSMNVSYRTSSSTVAPGWPSVANVEKKMSIAIVCME